MRDLNEQMNDNQNSRAKLKQRIAGGAVLIIVLAIFLPFIFHHSHAPVPAAESETTAGPAAQNAPASQPVAVAPVPAAQPTTVPVDNTVATAGQAANSTQAAQPNSSAAANNSTAQADSETQPQTQQSDADSNSDPTLRSDQPGLTPPQNESASDSGAQPATTAPQQSMPAQPSTEATTPADTIPAPAPTPIRQSQVRPSNPAKPHKVAAVMAPVKSVHTASATSRQLPVPGKVNVAKAKVIPSTNWVVQVGSFSQAQYARDLAAKLRAKGLQAYTKQGPNQMVRVYVGPLASQQQAQKIQQQVHSEFQLSGLVSKKPAIR